MQLCHNRPVVKSCPNGIKRLSNSIELGAQYVSPHQIPKRPHLQEKDMPVALSYMEHVACHKLKLQPKQKVCGCSARRPREECISQGSHGTTGAAGLLKNGAEMKRPTVAIYLDELPT